MPLQGAVSCCRCPYPSRCPQCPTAAPSALQAWAIYKGKYHEGTDKADPSTWKTRLRCALNKSTDFQEVPERSQLDISEPYKVYQIVSDGARDADKDGHTESPGCKEQRLSRPSPSRPSGTNLSSWPEKGNTTGSPAMERLTRHRPSAPGQRRWEPPSPASPSRFPQVPSGHVLTRPRSRVPLSRQGNTTGSPDMESLKGETETASSLTPSPAHPADRGYHVRGLFYGWNPSVGPLFPGPLSYGPTEDINHSAGARAPGGSVPPQVEPVFARELLHHAQRMGPQLLREAAQPCAPGASHHIVHVLRQLCQP
ncbi:PREDICTED: interferon regulatory factor 9-like [Tinamus guttatus]|uniref:interferon regulatory factor 9-like n=1 Tax=Tinamus guttatus TaxID=94827 RepID=UPI00052EE067|nr:PREDICTED: interferon regulatory factor 9-like [Tinamus guttatus]